MRFYIKLKSADSSGRVLNQIAISSMLSASFDSLVPTLLTSVLLPSEPECPWTPRCRAGVQHFFKMPATSPAAPPYES